MLLGKTCAKRVIEQIHRGFEGLFVSFCSVLVFCDFLVYPLFEDCFFFMLFIKEGKNMKVVRQGGRELLGGGWEAEYDKSII